MAREVRDNETRGGAHQGPRTAKEGAARLLVYAPPFLAWALLWAAGALIWDLWGRDPVARAFYSAGAAAVTLLFIAWVWQLTRARSETLRLLACLTAAGAGLWLVFAGIVGPTRRPLADLYVGFGLATCVFWAARRATLSAKGEQTIPYGQVGDLVKLLDGARVRKPRALEGAHGMPIIEGRLEVDRGRQTVKDLQDKGEHLTNLLGLRPGAVTIGRDHDAQDSGMAVARFVPVDPLALPSLWPGPSRPGASVDEPFPVGIYEDGSITQMWLTGDEDTGRALAMWLIMAVTGAGKSQAAVMLIADVLTRREVFVIGVDTRKGLQTFMPVLAGLHKVALNEATGRAMVEGIKRAIPARSKFLGQRGYKQWASGCGLQLVVFWVEEANWLANSAGLKKLVQECRSVGIVVIVSLQRASHTNMDTDTRAQLTGNWCFGVQDDIDATFALPEEVLDAGARPDRWSNREPGKSYLVAPGIPEKHWAMPLRAYWAKDPQVAAAVRESAVNEDLDDTTRQAFGPAFDTWPTGAQIAAGAAGGEFEQLADALVPVASGELVDDADPDDEGDDGQSDDDGMPPLGPQLEPGLRVDPRAPVGAPPPAVAGFTFGPPQPAGEKLSTVAARAVVDQHLRTLLAQGHTYATPADIDEMRPPTTRSREWVRQELKRRCEAAEPGEVALTLDLDADRPGMFVIHDPTPALAGR